MPFSDYNYIIDIITRKFIFFSFSLFSFKRQNWYYTFSEYLCSLKLITYRNTIIIIIIDYLYCYYNWWQLASENPYGYSMCCLRTYCVSFSSIFYLYTESVYFILLCNMSNKILPYHIEAPLRSISSLTLWGPPQIKFFAYYMGAPSYQCFRLLYGALCVSFFAYYIGAPLRSVSSIALCMGAPHVSFFAYLMSPSRQFFHLIYGAPSIRFLAYYMGPTDQCFLFQF